MKLYHPCRLTWKAEPTCPEWGSQWHGCHNMRDHHRGRCVCACGNTMPKHVADQLRKGA